MLSDIDPMSFLARGVCISGITFASRRLLTKWQVVQSLVPPLSLDDAPVPASPAPASPEHKVPVWQRIKKNKWFAFMVSFTLFLGAEVLFAYVLPKYGSRLLLDIFWGSVEGLLFTFVFNNAIEIAFPRPTTLHYTRPKPEGAYQLAKVATNPESEPTFMQRLSVRMILALCLTGATYLGVYNGHYWALGGITAGWTMMLLCNMTYPKLQTKYVVGIMLGYVSLLVAVLVIVLAIVQVVEHFKSDSPSTTPETDTDSGNDMATPSDWTTRLMMSFSDVWGFVMPGILIALNMRFDNRNLPRTMIARTTVDVPTTDTPVTSAPLFITSILSLAAGIGLVDVFSTGTPGEVIRLMNGIVVTAPLVCASTALVAWKRGELGEWWAYTETWVPAAPTTVIVPAEQDEKVSDAELALAADDKPAEKQVMVSKATFNLMS